MAELGQTQYGFNYPKTKRQYV